MSTICFHNDTMSEADLIDIASRAKTSSGWQDVGEEGISSAIEEQDQPPGQDATDQHRD